MAAAGGMASVRSTMPVTSASRDRYRSYIRLMLLYGLFTFTVRWSRRSRCFVMVSACQWMDEPAPHPRCPGISLPIGHAGRPGACWLCASGRQPSKPATITCIGGQYIAAVTEDGGVAACRFMLVEQARPWMPALIPYCAAHQTVTLCGTVAFR